MAIKRRLLSKKERAIRSLRKLAKEDTRASSVKPKKIAKSIQKKQIVKNKKIIKGKKKFPKKVSRPSQKKKAVKKVIKKALKKRRPPFVVTVNDTKVTRKAGLRKTSYGVDIVALTGVKPDEAIVRHNGIRVELYTKLSIRHGDTFEVKRIKRKKKAVRIPRSKRPGRGRTVKKTAGERKIHTAPSVVTESKIEWVNAFPQEWLKWDGAVAVEPSFVRADPRAAEWYTTMRLMAHRRGIESEEFRQLVSEIARLAGRPLQEAYTLFWSN